MFTTLALCILFVLPLIDIGNGAFDDHLAMDFNINQNYSANLSEVSQKERQTSEGLNESVDETKTEVTAILWAEQTGDKPAEEIYVDPNPTVQPKYNSLPNTKPNRNRLVTPNLQDQQQQPTAFPQANTAQINNLQVTPYASLIQAQEGPDLLHKRSRNTKISDKIVGGVTNIHSEETVTRPNFIQSNEIEPPILMDDSSASSSEMGGVSKNVYREMKDDVLLDRDRRSYADFSNNQYGSGVLQVRAEFRLTPVYKNTTKSITEFLTNHIIPFIRNMSNQPFTDVESFSSNLINANESYTEVEVDIQLRSKEDGYLSEDDRLVRLVLATAFKNLTTLLNYSVSHKRIQNITDIMVSYSCISCKSNEVCIQNSPTNDVWNCIVSQDEAFPFGVLVGDKMLPRDNELATVKIVIKDFIPFQTTLHDSLWLSVNGLISFGEEFASFSPQRLPAKNSQNVSLQVLAPYWTDLDFKTNDDNEITYQLYQCSPDRPSDVCRKANSEVVSNSKNNPASYTATSVLVVTWIKVPAKKIKTSDNERVSFQCVIISDGQTSYVIYLYMQGAMNLNPTYARSVEVGWGNVNFDTTRYSYYTFDRILGNTGKLGIWFFKLGETTNYNAKCLSWFQTASKEILEITAQNNGLPACPCNELAAKNSPTWISTSLSQTEGNCYDLLPNYGEFGRRCCYRSDGSSSFESRRPLAGSLQRYNAFYYIKTKSRDHEVKGGE